MSTSLMQHNFTHFPVESLTERTVQEIGRAIIGDVEFTPWQDVVLLKYYERTYVLRWDENEQKWDNIILVRDASKVFVSKGCRRLVALQMGRIFIYDIDTKGGLSGTSGWPKNGVKAMDFAVVSEDAGSIVYSVDCSLDDDTEFTLFCAYEQEPVDDKRDWRFIHSGSYANDYRVRASLRAPFVNYVVFASTGTKVKRNDSVVYNEVIKLITVYPNLGGSVEDVRPLGYAVSSDGEHIATLCKVREFKDRGVEHRLVMVLSSTVEHPEKAGLGTVDPICCFVENANCGLDWDIDKLEISQDGKIIYLAMSHLGTVMTSVEKVFRRSDTAVGTLPDGKPQLYDFTSAVGCLSLISPEEVNDIRFPIEATGAQYCLDNKRRPVETSKVIKTVIDSAA